MKIDICPNLDQIRFFARSALHAWDYQDLESGRDQVIADMEALLKYLGAFDDSEGVVVASVSRIKAGIRVERSILLLGAEFAKAYTDQRRLFDLPTGWQAAD
jgi:hypothetical protein